MRRKLNHLASHRRQTTADPRRGTLAIELLFALPLAMLLVICAVGMSQTLSARQTLASACKEGARLAATGSTPAEVQQFIETAIGVTLSQIAEITVDYLDAGVSGVSQATVVVTIRLPAASTPTVSLPWFARGMTVQSVMRME